MFKITSEPLSINELTALVQSDEAGAIATFIGTVRSHNEGRKVLYLEYSAYIPMAEAKMQEIAEEVQKKWRITKIAMHHRVGRLEIGEASVMIAVSSEHRRQALEACHYAIDRLKQIVPIWKKEVFEGGEVWVGSSGGG
jgi:molybdopterin synthase catalytic subunit